MCNEEQDAGATTCRLPTRIRILDRDDRPTEVLLVSNLDVTVQNFGPLHQRSPDPDSFRLEVSDCRETATALPRDRTTLEALKPNGSSFSPPRRFEVDMYQVPGSPHHYRSNNLRLVVDDADEGGSIARSNIPAALLPAHLRNQPSTPGPKQTLLTDWDPQDHTVEILGQIVRATYRSATQAAFTDQATVGANCQWIELAVHILRQQPGTGPGVVSTADVHQRIYKWVRRVFAQINLSPRLHVVETVDAAANVLAISHPHGRSAAGRGRIIAFATCGSDRCSINVPIDRGDTPMDAANAIANLSNPNFRARVVENPVGNDSSFQGRSADVIVTHSSGDRVVITGAVSTVQDMTVEAASPNVTRLDVVDSDEEMYLGSVDQRAQCYAYDSGPNRLDIYIAQDLSNRVIATGSADIDLGGLAMIRGSLHSRAECRRVADEVSMSVFIAEFCMNGTDSYPYTCAHEMGHVLLDAGHVNTAGGDPQSPSQLMRPTASANYGTGASKRIAEIPLRFTGVSQTIDPNQRMRQQGRSVLTNF